MSSSLTPGIRFIVTSSCNYNCIYCHNEWEPKTRQLLNTEIELIEELIKSIKKVGGREVDITGGEPLIEIERVKVILKLAKKYDMFTNLTTNGYFLFRYSKILSDLGLNEIHVHIPTLNPKLYRNLMRGNAHLSDVLRGIKEIKDKIPIIKANIPVEVGINENEIPELLEYFNKQKIIPRFIEMMPTFNYNAKKQKIFDEVIKSKLEGNVFLRKSYRWGINEYEHNGKLFETLRCICFDRKCNICSKTNFIHIDQEYKIRPCNLRSFKIQSTKEDCLKQILEAISYLKHQRDIPLKYKKLWGKKYFPLTKEKT